ncbi:MAG: head GIN domain-containing protein [Bacteroidales bacterium]
MKKILLPLLLGFITVIVAGHLFAGDKNKLNMKYTQTRDISSFHSIKVSSMFNVYVSPGTSSKLEIKATHDLLNKIQTNVENGELIINMDKSDCIRNNFYKNLEINIYVSCDHLRRIRASGATDVYSTGLLRADDLDISVSGASDVKMDVQVSHILKCSASGSSDIKLSGSASSADLTASGASDIDFKKFFIKTANVVASGSCDIILNVSESLTAKASGACDIVYYGDPKTTNVHAGGSSDIVRRVK